MESCILRFYISNLKNILTVWCKNIIMLCILLQKNFDNPKNKKIKNKRKKILITSWHYRPNKARSKNEISPEKYYLTNTLKNSKLADVKNIYYDKVREANKFLGVDLELLKTCNRHNINAIVLSSWDPYTSSMPCSETLRYLALKMGIKIFTIWWDSCGKSFYKTYLNKADKFTYLHVFIDKMHIQIKGKKPFLNLWCPIDGRLFKKKYLKKTIDVSFIGSTNHYRDYRNNILDVLKRLQNKCRIVILRSCKKRLSYQTYADILNRSKISLNLSRSIGNYHQVKARVYESMNAGALVLETTNNETTKRFQVGKEILHFKSSKDLLRKIKLLLSKPRTLDKYAAAGEKKAKSVYNSRIFWKKIINAI